MAGHKTETRRIIKNWPLKIELIKDIRSDIPFIPSLAVAPKGIYLPSANPHGALSVIASDGEMIGVKPGEFRWVTRYGSRPGDFLYVREAWYDYGYWGLYQDGNGEQKRKWKSLTTISGRFKPKYFADGEVDTSAIRGNECRWRKMPSIHLPKRYSRNWLRVLGIGVEYLHDITEVAAIREGTPKLYRNPEWLPNEARESFACLWDTINAKRGFPFSNNPRIVAIRYEKLSDEEKANIGK